VFCSFNGSHKLNPELFDIWMQLLREITGSVLWLLGGSTDVRGNLRAEAERRGVDGDRLVFAERLDYRDHLTRLQLADLFLDSLPFNAGTTASDALWVGLPVLTCSGDALAARMAGSLLRALDAPELVTSSRDEYARTAIRLARAPQELRRLRERLIENRERSPLFDTDRFRRHLESAYVQIWERLQRGEGPTSFEVAPLTSPKRAAEGARASDPP
jgi:predicted O-linked N-acetylglucosamine transferase (SPINDLY family)